jgi:hypothetical protein
VLSAIHNAPCPLPIAHCTLPIACGLQTPKHAASPLKR